VYVDDANDILKIIEIKKHCGTNLTIIGGVESWTVMFLNLTTGCQGARRRQCECAIKS
jgi:hypothetical protein